MMDAARIVEYRQHTSIGGVGAAPRATAVRPFNAGAGLMELAQGLQQVVGDIRERDEEEARAWSAGALSKARLDWTQQFIDRQETAEPGAKDFTPNLLKDFDKYSQDLIDTAPSNAAKRFMAERMHELRTTIGTRAMEFEAGARIDYRNDQFEQSINNHSKLMNTDPSQFETALAEQLATIDSSAMPPTKKSAIRQKAISEISEAAVWSQIQRSPAQFLQSIGFESPVEGKTNKSSDILQGKTNNKAFDMLPADKRIQMFEGAIRLKSQIDADAEKSVEKQRKLMAEEMMKEAWGRLADGKLTRAYIEEIRPLLNDSEYRSLLQARKEGRGQNTDPGTFRKLQQMIYDDPAGAEKFALQAHRNGLISNDVLSSSLSRSREIGRTEGPRSEYERSRQLIIGSLDPGPLVQDPVGRSRLAEALYTFDSWVKVEQRNDVDIEKRAREIIGQYKFIDLSDTVAALPYPRAGQIRRNLGDRNGMMSDIASVSKVVQDKFQKGQITRAEYEQEMAILNRWRKAAQGNK